METAILRDDPESDVKRMTGHETTSLIGLIAGMTLATYLPRLAPFLMMQDMRLPPRAKRFLELIPFTALGALVMPGVLTSVPNQPLAMTAGIVFAAIWAWFKGGIVVSVAGAIAIVYLVLMLGAKST